MLSYHSVKLLLRLLKNLRLFGEKVAYQQYHMHELFLTYYDKNIHRFWKTLNQRGKLEIFQSKIKDLVNIDII